MSTFVLVHGFWVGPSSWDLVAPGLEAAGHTVARVTLPGTASLEQDRAGVGLVDLVDAVLAAVDDADGPLDDTVLVGSSFAGKLVQIVSELRPGLRLAVHVDSLPKPIVGSDQPPGPDLAFAWDEFTDDELRDLTDEQRRTIESEAVPFPASPIREDWDLRAGRRFDVPTLVVATAFTGDDVREWRESYGIGPELDGYRSLSIVELPTSHWPQLTRPDDLVELLLGPVPAG